MMLNNSSRSRVTYVVVIDNKPTISERSLSLSAQPDHPMFATITDLVFLL